VTNARETAKIRTDLIQRLDSASAYLALGGSGNYYLAAKSMYGYNSRLYSLLSNHKVSQAEGFVCFNLGVATGECIELLY
jgi:hypothetical protein